MNKYCFLLFLVIIFSCKSVDSYLKQSYSSNQVGNYEEELYFLKKSFDEGSSISTGRRIAFAYYNLRDFPQAEFWFKWIRSRSNLLIKEYYIFAEVLIGNAKYTEAKFLLEDLASFDESQTSTTKWQNLMRIIFESANEIINHSDKEVFNYSSINSPFSDIAFFKTSNKKYFFSNRFSSGNEKSRFDEFNSFGKTYYKIYDFDSSNFEINPSFVQEFRSLSSSGFHIGPSYLSDSISIFTYSGINSKIYPSKSETKFPQLLLLTNKKFERLFNTDTDNYFMSDPFLDKKNMRIFFTANFPDSFGGLDLYYVSFNSDSNKWSEPINCGPLINTLENERSPFFQNDTLFYSSNGNGGLGGYDIFYSYEVNKGFSKPSNMGIPYNSSGDDLFYFRDEVQKLEFISSDRIGGFGSDDIYYIKSRANSVENLPIEEIKVDSAAVVTNLKEEKKIHYQDFRNVSIFDLKNVFNESQLELVETEDYTGDFDWFIFQDSLDDFSISYKILSNEFLGNLLQDYSNNSETTIQILFHHDFYDDMEFSSLIQFLDQKFTLLGIDSDRVFISFIERDKFSFFKNTLSCNFDEDSFMYFLVSAKNNKPISTIKEDSSFQYSYFMVNVYSWISKENLNVNLVYEADSFLEWNSNFYLVIGSFQTLEKANELRDSVKKFFPEATLEIIIPNSFSDRYRVSIKSSSCLNEILDSIDYIRARTKITDSWVLVR